MNDASNIAPGDWITIAGVTGAKIVIAKNGTTLTVHSNCDATVDDGAVAYSAAAFKGFGDIAA